MARDFIIYPDITPQIIEKLGYSLEKQSVNGPVKTFYSASEGLYAGGNFAGYFNRIARWDGQKWNKVGDGIFSNYDTGIPSLRFGTITDITKFKNTLYCSARRFYIDKTTDKKTVLYKFQKQKWTPIIYDECPDDSVCFTNKMFSTDNYLFLVGNYGADEFGNNHTVLRWDGEQLIRLDDGAFVEALSVFYSSNTLYVGGYSFLEGYSNIRTLQENIWNNLPQLSDPLSLSYEISTIDYISDKIYALLYARNIYKLEGEEWVSVGDLTSISEFKKYGNDIYAVGGFNNQYGQGISRWNGYEWISLGDKLSNYAVTVRNVSSCSNGIYVGSFYGEFNHLTGTYISRWDGTKWNPVLSDATLHYEIYPPESSLVTKLVSSSEGLYVCGNFTNGVKLWNGQEYSDLDGGVVFTYWCNMITSSDGIYVSSYSGSQENFDNTIFCRWNGESWKNITSSYGSIYSRDGLLSCSQGIYSYVTVNDEYNNQIQKLLLWDGSNFTEIISNIEPRFYNSLSIKSGSEGIYFAGEQGSGFEEIKRWNGSEIVNISAPTAMEYVGSVIGEGLQINESGKIFSLFRKNDEDGYPKFGLYELNENVWSLKIDLPSEYNYYTEWPTYYKIIGSGSSGIYLNSYNPEYLELNKINSNFSTVYLYNGQELQKIIDTNAGVIHAIETSEGLYLCGSFDRQGYKVMLVRDSSNDKVRQNIFVNNNVITVRKMSPYIVNL